MCNIKTFNITWLTILCVFVGLLTSCDFSIEKEYKNSYSIELGADVFQIPVDYIAFSEQRADGAYDYVPTTAMIPGLEPIENMRFRRRPPTTTKYMIKFNMSYASHGITLMNSLNGYEEHDWFSLPDFSKLDGFIYLGIHKVAGKQREKIYVFVKDGRVRAVFNCGMRPDYESPGCRISQIYNEKILLIVGFKIENLEWYVSEGMDKVLDLVESWSVKSGAVLGNEYSKGVMKWQQ